MPAIHVVFVSPTKFCCFKPFTYGSKIYIDDEHYEQRQVQIHCFIPSYCSSKYKIQTRNVASAPTKKKRNECVRFLLHEVNKLNGMEWHQLHLRAQFLLRYSTYPCIVEQQYMRMPWCPVLSTRHSNFTTQVNANTNGIPYVFVSTTDNGNI